MSRPTSAGRVGPAVRPAPAARACRRQIERLEPRRLLSAAGGFVPGELIVGFEPGVGQSAIRRFYAEHGFTEVEAMDRDAGPRDRRLKLVAVPADRTTALIPALERDPRVAYAEPNYVVAMTPAAVTPTDLFYANQDYLNNAGQWGGTPDADVDAPEAWRATTGSPDVLVAVIDTGVDYTHPELVANMWTNPFEVPGDGVDNDRNGYVDDVHGIDTAANSGDPMDDEGHGTSVAGVIGGTPFNEGTAGVAWRVGIIAINIWRGPGDGTIADAVQAFQYVNHLKRVQGQNVVATNNSWGGNDPNVGASQALKDALAGPRGMKPILHVCAATNANTDSDVDPYWPAAFPLANVVSVASVDATGRYASDSNYGARSVDLAAPGAAIVIAPAPGGRYDYQFGGTSAAAPMVTGAAALAWSVFPTLTAAQVKARLLAGVDPIGHIGDNADKPTLTNGRLNIPKVLAGAPREADRTPPAAVARLGESATTFHSVTLRWQATGDDGRSGRAAFYDVRYATSPVTDATWGLATRALGEPGPRPAGAAETFTVGGLEPGKRYFFALKVRDNMGNQSRLSDGAEATTGPARVLFSDGFEAGANGWAGTGLWHLSDRRSARDRGTAWYYGREATGNCNTGGNNQGSLTSPAIDLRADAVRPTLIYREWRSVEDVSFRDSATVQVSAGGGPWRTVLQSELGTAAVPLNWQPTASGFGWNQTVTSPLSRPVWVARSVDLSRFAGKKVKVRLAFDTIDEAFNGYEGWYVDSVNVYGVA